MVTGIQADCVEAQTNGVPFTVPADVVVMAIASPRRPSLAAEAGLEIGKTRGIKVNHNYQTSDPDIYAVGDAVESYDALRHCPGRLALAGPAQRQARAAAGSHLRHSPQQPGLHWLLLHPGLFPKCRRHRPERKAGPGSRLFL